MSAQPQEPCTAACWTAELCPRCGKRMNPRGRSAPLEVACLTEPCPADDPSVNRRHLWSATDEERFRFHDDREDWPVHRPECFDAPIPGRQWYAGCEPGGDYDSELDGYHGQGPRVDPLTGICVGCDEKGCAICGRENCPEHAGAF